MFPGNRNYGNQEGKNSGSGKSLTVTPDPKEQNRLTSLPRVDRGHMFRAVSSTRQST